MYCSIIAGIGRVAREQLLEALRACRTAGTAPSRRARPAGRTCGRRPAGTASGRARRARSRRRGSIRSRVITCSGSSPSAGISRASASAERYAASSAARPSGPRSGQRSLYRSSPSTVAHIGSRSRRPSQNRSARSLTAALGSRATDIGGHSPCRSFGGQAASVALRRSAPEQVGQQRRRGLLELVVAAVGRRAIVPPALERRRVAEAIALEVVEGHLAHELGPERLPASGPCHGSSARSRRACGGPARPRRPRRAPTRATGDRPWRRCGTARGTRPAPRGGPS